MQYEAPGTLARIVGSPLRQKRRIDIPASQLAGVLGGTVKKNQTEGPDASAVRFYALNQLISVLFQKFTPNEQLPDWAQSIADDYERELVHQHRMLTWYTFLVICREFRHLKNPTTVFKVKHIGYSQGIQDLHPMIKDTQDESTLNMWLSKVPADPLDHFCKCITHAFNTGSFGGGYGGKPWGQISDTLRSYFAGDTSAEIFIDTAYTLAHNNGPMFNKGMFYKMYTDQFKSVLDIQRAGMICEGLVSGQLSNWFSVPGRDKLLGHIQAINKAFPGTVGEYVDWYAVEALGALGFCGGYKAEQDKKYGKKAQKILVNGQPVQMTGQEFQVMPGANPLKIYKRLKAA